MLATYERKKVTEYTSFNYELKCFTKANTFVIY